MPLIEDGEYAEYQRLKAEFPQAKNFEKVWTEVLGDPALRPQAQRLVKAKFPHVSIPEIDTADAATKPLLEKIEAMEKRLEEKAEADAKREAEREERDRERSAKSTISEARRKLKAAGWDDEGIDKIEAVMQEHNIGNYDIAAEYVRSTLPKPAPLTSAYEGRDLNWFNPDEGALDHKLLMENPNKFKSEAVKKFFTDRANGNMSAWA
jgi:hypothetical protein